MEKIRKMIPLSFMISLFLALISFVFLKISIANPAFADKINSGIGTFLRRAFAAAADLVSASVFEIIICLIPVFTALLIFFAVRAFKNRRKMRFILHFSAFVLLIYSLYVFMMGISYHTTTLDKKMSLDAKSDITAGELAETLEHIIPKVNALAESQKLLNGETEMPYDMDELSAKLSLAYSSVAEKYGLFRAIESRAKPIYHSGVMSSLRITGIYTFYTGECNINMAYPDYNLPFTAAHEFAHRHGILRENEANFVAFLVCIESDDPYINYSGYLNMYEYLISALYRTDKDMWRDVASTLNDISVSDIKASNAVSEKYGNSFIGEISNKINDFYLKQNGTPGTVSYGLVTRLAVAYYKNTK